ncbi:hypothetical protein [Nonomuraea sp. NPDC050202]|uniref:hypothetical protein n=1 Tax=Nonomuraea sp. NPDC050202 TaxID=3155035 RepID=UPI0033C45FD1
MVAFLLGTPDNGTPAPRRELVLMDRGPAMLEAGVTATAAVRLGLEHARAAEHARALLAPYTGGLEAAFDGVSELQRCCCTPPTPRRRRPGAGPPDLGHPALPDLPAPAASAPARPPPPGR